MGKKNSTENKTGINQLTPEQEQMRMQVVDLEMKARYWKAQFEIRNYTLESEKLQKPYDEFLLKTKEAQDKAYAEFMAAMEKEKANTVQEPEQREVSDVSK